MKPFSGSSRGPRLGPGVRFVVGAALGVAHGHVSVLLEVVERAAGRVHRQVREVGGAEALQLRVEVAEVAALKQGIVGEVDPRHDGAGLEGHLLGLGEEVVHEAVEHEAADLLHGDQLLGDDLGGVEDVEVELVGEVVVEDLEAQLPFREIALLDGVPQIAAVEVGIGAVELQRLVPDHGLEALLRLPVELDVGGFALRVDHAEGVDAEPLHEAEGPGDRAVRHDPHDHVHALGHQGDEVPEVVMRGLGLGEASVGLLLGGVDQVGELDRVLDEEHGDVVADDVPVALLRVELHREAAHVASEVGGALIAGDGGEADERLGLFSGALEDVGAGDVGEGLVGLEIAVSAVAAGVDHPLGDALVVEVEDLFAEGLILDQKRAAGAGAQRVLVVGDRHPQRGGHGRRAVARRLVKFAGRASGRVGVAGSVCHGCLPRVGGRRGGAEAPLMRATAAGVEGSSEPGGTVVAAWTLPLRTGRRSEEEA